MAGFVALRWWTVSSKGQMHLIGMYNGKRDAEVAISWLCSVVC